MSPRLMIFSRKGVWTKWFKRRFQITNRKRLALKKFKLRTLHHQNLITTRVLHLTRQKIKMLHQRILIVSSMTQSHNQCIHHLSSARQNRHKCLSIQSLSTKHLSDLESPNQLPFLRSLIQRRSRVKILLSSAMILCTHIKTELRSFVKMQRRILGQFQTLRPKYRRCLRRS